MPRKQSKDDLDADRERILNSLRAIIDAPGTSSRALAAKYAASMRLAKMTGIPSPDPEQDEEPHARDPMEFLDDLECLRRRRARR